VETRPDGRGEVERPWQKLTILDNSFGSGRMFQFADPEKHALFGIEKDEQVVQAVREVVSAAASTAN